MSGGCAAGSAPSCHGTRYNAKTLEIKYRGRSIADALGMTVDAAWEFFADEPHVHRSLRWSISDRVRATKAAASLPPDHRPHSRAAKGRTAPYLARVLDIACGRCHEKP